MQVAPLQSVTHIPPVHAMAHDEPSWQWIAHEPPSQPMSHVAPVSQAIRQPPGSHDMSHACPSAHSQMSLELHTIFVEDPPDELLDPLGTLQSSAQPHSIATTAIQPRDLAVLVRIIVPGPC